MTLFWKKNFEKKTLFVTEITPRDPTYIVATYIYLFYLIVFIYM